MREGRRTGKWRELNRHTLKRSSKNLEIPSILGPFSDLSLGFFGLLRAAPFRRQWIEAQRESSAATPATRPPRPPVKSCEKGGRNAATRQEPRDEVCPNESRECYLGNGYNLEIRRDT